MQIYDKIFRTYIHLQVALKWVQDSTIIVLKNKDSVVVPVANAGAAGDDEDVGRFWDRSGCRQRDWWLLLAWIKISCSEGDVNVDWMPTNRKPSGGRRAANLCSFNDDYGNRRWKEEKMNIQDGLAESLMKRRVEIWPELTLKAAFFSKQTNKAIGHLGFFFLEQI